MPYFLDKKLVEKIVAATITALQQPVIVDNDTYKLMSDAMVAAVQKLLTEKLNEVKLTGGEYHALIVDQETDDDGENQQEDFVVRVAGSLTFKSTSELPSNENTKGFGLAGLIFRRVISNLIKTHTSVLADGLNSLKPLAPKLVAAEVHVALAQILDVEFGFNLLDALLLKKDHEPATRQLREEAGLYATVYSEGATETWKNTIRRVREEVRPKYALAVKEAAAQAGVLEQRFPKDKVEVLLNSEPPSHADETNTWDIAGSPGRLFKKLGLVDNSPVPFELSNLNNGQ